MSDLTGISAVIVSYNSHESTLETIQALKMQALALRSILVVDNASTDATTLEIRASFPDVHLIELKENVGLSRARNIGLRASRTELVLLTDDDVYLEPEGLQQMMKTQQATGACAVCPRIIFHPQVDSVQCDGAAIHFAGMLMLRNAGTSPDIASQAFATSAFIGACVLVNRNVLLELDGFDEDYFFYLEDMELSYRLRALGHRIVCEPNALAFHDRGRGTPGLSFRGAGPYPPRRVYYTLRHRWLTMLLHYQARTLALLAPVLVVYEVGAFVLCVVRGWLRDWLRAAWSMLRGLPGILSRRQRWQHARRVGDREILVGGPLPFASGFVRGRLAAGMIRLLNAILNSYWSFMRRWA